MTCQQNDCELWKVVANHPEYEVSNLGRVRRIKSGRFLKYGSDKRGYLLVTLCSNGKPKKYQVHRVVGREFVCGYKDYLQINHKDGNKKNNHSSNLEWVTAKENVKHAFKNGLNRPGKHLNNPKTHPSFKGMIIARSIDTGEEIELFGEKDMERKGFIGTLVYKCLKGKSAHHRRYTFKRMETHADI